MNDPFDVLRIDDAPIAPSAEFTTRLRARLADETDEMNETNQMNETSSTTMTTTTTDAAAEATVHISSVQPYLTVRGGAAALDFYRDAFGAVEHHRLVGDDGRIGHAELSIGATRFALADELPEMDVLGPQSRGGATCLFTVHVDDVDAATARAERHGAVVARPPEDQFHGNRTASIVDPFGHPWMLLTPIRELSTEEYAAAGREGGYTVVESTPAEDLHQLKRYDAGDLYYFGIMVPDVERAKRFFGGLLGWEFADGGGGSHISSISAPTGGLQPGTGPTDLYFVVDDLRAAVTKVRELGGAADEQVDYDSGGAAKCTDDQGTPFYLSTPADKYRL